MVEAPSGRVAAAAVNTDADAPDGVGRLEYGRGRMAILAGAAPLRRATLRWASPFMDGEPLWGVP